MRARLALGAALAGFIGTLFAGFAPPVSGATATFAPYVVTRAGSSDVIYALWQSGDCALRRCVRLERSANGGATFRRVSTPPIGRIKPGMDGDTPAIEQLVFANADVGYAVEAPSNGRSWETTTYFLTTNGARTWKKVPLAPHAYNLSFATSGRYFYAMTMTCPSKGPCSNFDLRRSSVSSTTWTRLAIPPMFLKISGGNLNIGAAGSKVWITTQNQRTVPYLPYIATSTNEGRTFSVTVQPDLSSAAVCELIPASSLVIWANCDGGNQQDNIVYSSDGGVRWQTQHVSGLLAYKGVEAFDPISTRSAYFVNTSLPNTLYRVSSEASPPQKVASLPSGRYWSSIVFTNAKDGVMMTRQDGPSLQLYGTQNGGVSWRRITLSS